MVVIDAPNLVVAQTESVAVVCYFVGFHNNTEVNMSWSRNAINMPGKSKLLSKNT